MANDIFKNNSKIAKDYQRQLKQPFGKLGSEVGKHLYEGNKEVIDKTINEIKEVQDDSVIVDVGCGPGYSLEVLAKKFPNSKIIGIDPSDEMIEMAASNNSVKVKSGQIALIKGETPNLPIADNTVDYLLLMNVLYFWEFPLEHLPNVYRVIKKGGSLLIYITDKDSLSRRIDEKDGIFNMHNTTGVIKNLESAGFTNVTDKKVNRHFSQVGFIIKAIK